MKSGINHTFVSVLSRTNIFFEKQAYLLVFILFVEKVVQNETHLILVSGTNFHNPLPAAASRRRGLGKETGMAASPPMLFIEEAA